MIWEDHESKYLDGDYSMLKDRSINTDKTRTTSWYLLYTLMGHNTREELAQPPFCLSRQECPPSYKESYAFIA
jgi:hypothetical protein